MIGVPVASLGGAFVHPALGPEGRPPAPLIPPAPTVPPVPAVAAVPPVVLVVPPVVLVVPPVVLVVPAVVLVVPPPPVVLVVPAVALVPPIVLAPPADEPAFPASLGAGAPLQPTRIAPRSPTEALIIGVKWPTPPPSLCISPIQDH